MPRRPSPEQEQAKHLYLESDGQMLLKDIADAIGKSAEQVRKWKSTGKWDDELKGNVTKSKGNVTKRRESTKSGPAPPDGFPSPSEGMQFPKRMPRDKGGQLTNQNAVTHGLYRKHLPQSIQNLIEEVRGVPPLDVIYEMIYIDFAKIIEALRLMHVYDRDDHLKLIKKKRWDVGGKEGNGDDNGREQGIINEIEYEIHVAPELQAGAMKALATVQAALRANIKLFMELSGLDDKRRLEIESMQASLDKTRAEIDKLKGGGDDVATVVFVEDLDD